MVKAGFQLDAKAYTILIGGFSRRKRLQRLISGLVYTYNTLLSALCKVGHFSAVDELLGKMIVVGRLRLNRFSWKKVYFNASELLMYGRL
ncbi:hypothetical protein TRIUR3_15816 [Triticum urartu]|uniref:Pentatricopeptide repeat-containing protein n=1 Tax=Triticum urartu TaxID=4572 RepID=M8AKG8_TRIUA|nr:hypothetical protein TRIUR3_15816 [Triticum urartu]